MDLVDHLDVNKITTTTTILIPIGIIPIPGITLLSVTEPFLLNIRDAYLW